MSRADKIERMDSAADWAFSHVVECSLTSVQAARDDLRTWIAIHLDDGRWTDWDFAATLAEDAHFLRHAVRAARIWGAHGAGDAPERARVRCFDVVARRMAERL